MICKNCNTEFEPLKRNGIILSKLCIKCLSIKGKSKLKKVYAKEKKEAKDKIKTLSEHKNDLQILINELARVIDYGQPCIASGNFGKMNGGHYYSVSSNNTIRFNLHNIHIQSFASNHFKSGDNINYRNGLIKIYGNSYFELVESLQLIKPIHLSVEDIKEAKNTVKMILKELKENLQIREPAQRIELRNKCNELIGIYKN